jgi:hypothetical protein
MRKLTFSILAGAAALALAAPASAVVTVTYLDCAGASSCISDTDNVNLDSFFGNTATGHLGATAVNFVSTTDDLIAGQGQASISSGGQDILINNLTFSVGTGFFTTAEFNLTDQPDNATLIITTAGGVSQEFAIDRNGANRFGIQVTSTDLITSATLNSAAGFGTFSQLRLGGLTSATGSVPEPSTWAMMLFGFGGVGVAMRRRRRTGAQLAQVA